MLYNAMAKATMYSGVPNHERFDCAKYLDTVQTGGFICRENCFC